jgi:hypothetical protein
MLGLLLSDSCWLASNSTDNFVGILSIFTRAFALQIDLSGWPFETSRYESLRLPRQFAWVENALPQDSAMVSNTRSWRNAGLRYGFFPFVSFPRAACDPLEFWFPVVINSSFSNHSKNT